MSDQILVVSSSGKPIYYKGNETSNGGHLATIAGVIQTLVEFINQQQDTIKSIKAGETTISFKIAAPLTLVQVSKHPREDVLRHIHNLLLFILTETQLKKLYSERPDVDLRRVLAGSERLLNYLADRIPDEAGFFLSAVPYVSMESSARASLASHIFQVTKELKELVFAVLVAPEKDNTKAIVVVHKINYTLQADDLLLILNLVESTESYKTAEGWTPVCLPQFDKTGFLHAHISYLADDCPACLLLLTVNKNTFYELSEAKQNLVKRIRRAGLIDTINISMKTSLVTISQLGVPELRHFLYLVSTARAYIFPLVDSPYDRRSLIVDYEQLYDQINRKKLKLVFHRREYDVLFAWTTTEFQLYFVLEPLITKEQAIKMVGRVVHWVQKNQDCMVPRDDFTFEH